MAFGTAGQRSNQRSPLCTSPARSPSRSPNTPNASPWHPSRHRHHHRYRTLERHSINSNYRPVSYTCACARRMGQFSAAPLKLRTTADSHKTAVEHEAARTAGPRIVCGVFVAGTERLVPPAVYLMCQAMQTDFSVRPRQISSFNRVRCSSWHAVRLMNDGV